VLPGDGFFDIVFSSTAPNKTGLAVRESLGREGPGGRIDRRVVEPALPSGAEPALT
jgi:hypothetical protein